MEPPARPGTPPRAKAQQGDSTLLGAGEGPGRQRGANLEVHQGFLGVHQDFYEDFPRFEFDFDLDWIWLGLIWIRLDLVSIWFDFGWIWLDLVCFRSDLV